MYYTYSTYYANKEHMQWYEELNPKEQQPAFTRTFASPMKMYEYLIRAARTSPDVRLVRTFFIMITIRETN